MAAPRMGSIIIFNLKIIIVLAPFPGKDQFAASISIVTRAIRPTKMTADRSRGGAGFTPIEVSSGVDRWADGSGGRGGAAVRIDMGVELPRDASEIVNLLRRFFSAKFGDQPSVCMGHVSPAGSADI
jgi:hypothetical protein